MDHTYGMSSGTASYTGGAVISSAFNAATASQAHTSNATFDPSGMTLTGLSDNNVAGPSTTKRRQSETSESSKKKRAATISTGDLDGEQAAQAKDKKKKASRACIHCQKVRASGICSILVWTSDMVNLPRRHILLVMTVRLTTSFCLPQQSAPGY